MTENTLIALNEFKLPSDFAWRVKFMDAVDEHLRRLGVTGQMRPPRFFGYFFEGGEPVVLTGRWTVRLNTGPLFTRLELAVDRITAGEYPINSQREGDDPEFLLVHDRFDCRCWLWRFGFGRRFLESTDPVSLVPENSDTSELSGGEDQKLLGP